MPQMLEICSSEFDCQMECLMCLDLKRFAVAVFYSKECPKFDIRSES